MRSLLAVGVELKTGLAVFGDDGKLRWHRSRNLASAAVLKGVARGVLGDLPEVERLVLAGGGALAQVREREAVCNAQPWQQSDSSYMIPPTMKIPADDTFK